MHFASHQCMYKVSVFHSRTTKIGVHNYCCYMQCKCFRDDYSGWFGMVSHRSAFFRFQISARLLSSFCVEWRCCSFATGGVGESTRGSGSGEAEFRPGRLCTNSIIWLMVYVGLVEHVCLFTRNFAGFDPIFAGFPNFRLEVRKRQTGITANGARFSRSLRRQFHLHAIGDIRWHMCTYNSTSFQISSMSVLLLIRHPETPKSVRNIFVKQLL